MPEPTVDQELLQKKFGLAVDVRAGVMTAGAIYLGDRVGLYQALSGAGPVTSDELAERAGLDERFVREWLHQQAAAEIVEYRGEDRFELTHEGSLVFADADNPMSQIGGFARLPTMVERFVGAAGAFHSGLGQAFDAVADQDSLVRGPLQVWSRTTLVPEALPRVGNAVAVLERGAKVADIGCGAGAAPIAIAKAFPNTEVHGYDNWQGALDICEESKAKDGLTNVHFFNNDERPLPSEPTYDLMLTMDCLHDMARPDLVATAIRQAIKPDGYWFIVEIDGHEDFEQNLSQNPRAKMMYATSLVMCLQSSASEPDGLALGTLGLPEPRMRALAEEAGFTRFTRLDGITHPINAYYVAQP